MLTNKVDAVLSDKDVEEAMAAIDSLRQKLAFSIGLSPQERKGMTKIGRKSQTFTEEALDMAERHPELVPPGVNIEGARRDMDLFIAINPIVQALGELYQLAGDTQMVAGSEAYAAARVAYGSAKSLGVGMGLDDVIDELSLRFKRSHSSRKTRDEGTNVQG
jgi:hypothetical protein